MRICHVIEAGATGALEMALFAADIQRRRGHRVLLVYSHRPGTPGDLGTRIHPEVQLAPMRMRPLAAHLPVWWFRYRRALHRFNPEVLHLHSSFAGFFGRLAAPRRFAGRVLYSPHCISLMHLDLSRARRAAYRALERFAQVRRPALYLACSRPEQTVIAGEIDAPVRLLENAVADDLGAAFRRDRPPTAPLRRVVTCARIAPLKDPEAFAAICRVVRAQRPDIRFEWVGDGDPRARRSLVEAGVEVTGWLSRDAALQRVAAASVYLSTSRWEGLPISVLEAMALKVPVVCRRADWSADIVRDGVTGRLFDDDDSAASVLLDTDQAWCATVAETAWTMARERFSARRFATDLERLCRDKGAGAFV